MTDELIEQVREKIAQMFWAIQINQTGLVVAPADWSRLSEEGKEFLREKADQILSTVITEAGVCPECGGKGEVRLIHDEPIIECDFCQGTGQTKPVAILDAIKEKMG